MKFGGFDIRVPEILKLVTDWIDHGATQSVSEGAQADSVSPSHLGAIELFQEGNSLYRDGLRTEAVAKWKAALALQPDILVIHKQIWAVENPERFYDVELPDTDWQK